MGNTPQSEQNKDKGFSNQNLTLNQKSGLISIDNDREPD